MKKINVPYLQIEPTTVCNYTCGFCVGRHMPQKSMTLTIFSEVLESIQNLKYISIQGEGEPLLHRDFFEMVRIVKVHHPEASISFITNGSLFSSDNISQILSLGIKRIMVSIESADAERFREIRGGKLSKVQTGIKAFISERRKRNLKYPVIGFATTLLKSTLYDFNDVVALYNELEMDGGVAPQYLQAMESYSKIYDVDMKDEILGVEEVEYFENNIRTLPSYSDVFALTSDDSNFYFNLFSSEEKGCPWLSNGLYVDQNGVATGCCMIKDTNLFGFGKLDSSSGESIIEKRAAMHDQLLNGIIPAACKHCPIAESAYKKYHAI